ncbi:hypothetical protein FNYG_08625 [Fusarium nygamai]|uniref:Uncharacterized protein n=1 Tax=Gibberella nygamai TaxID=42673 RepID=A0A2K0W6J3_GIBNY|nr:hypothetical protein FNYG_08625 [Fusarium nygamai]
MVLIPITARPELSVQQSTTDLYPSVPSTPPPSEAETSEPDHGNEELERSLALRVLLLLSTIDHASSPNHANPLQLYDEAAKYPLSELIERCFKRLCERFKLNPRQPIPSGNALYLYAYEILGKALQSKGIRLEPLRLNMEVDDHCLDKELQNSEWALSAVGNGKLLADHGCYYDIMLDESPYIKISVKLSRLIDKLSKLKVQTVCPTAEYLPTHRLKLQQLRSMPRSKEDCFDKPIKDLSALFEDIERSNNTYNRQINYVRLQLYRGLSFNFAIMSDGFGLLDEVDDEHPPSESPSGSSIPTAKLEKLEQRVQKDSEKLKNMATQSIQILQSRLKENNATECPELSDLIRHAQITQCSLIVHSSIASFKYL